MTRPLSLALSTALALTLAACSQPEIETETPAPRVLLQTIADSDAETEISFVGRVEARQAVDLAFQVGGQLARIDISEGDAVTAGQVVAQLDRTDFDRAVREARVQLDQARTDLTRQQTLFDRGIASQAALDDAQTEFDLREVSLANARQNLDYTSLRAPFDGLVSRRIVDTFTVVSPGQPVMRVQDLSELRVSVPVPEYLIANVDSEDVVQSWATFPFLPGQRFELEPRETVTEADSASQTYRVILALPNDMPANILPGMTASVTAEFLLDEDEIHIQIPINAVTYTPDETPQVWVYDAATGTVGKRDVELNGLVEDEIVVLDGLSPGERIVVAGIHALHEGMSVRPFEEERD